MSIRTSVCSFPEGSALNQHIFSENVSRQVSSEEWWTSIWIQNSCIPFNFFHPQILSNMDGVVFFINSADLGNRRFRPQTRIVNCKVE